MPPIPPLVLSGLRFGMLGALLAGAPATAAQYELVLRGGTVHDGSGAAGFPADVGIADGRIRKIGDLSGATAARVLDARGLAVAPGFIDLHSHADAALRAPGAAIALNLLRQGVTTVVVGQDGRNGWPGAAEPGRAIRAWEDEGLTTNLVLLIGHGDLRRAAIGHRTGPPAPDEIDRMRSMVRAAMRSGAYGISTGLGYVPGRYASTEELTALIAEAAPFGGVHISHVRDQGDRLIESVEEIIEIAARTGVTSVATHFKAVRAPNYGKSARALRLIRRARTRGVPIYTDQYPYRTSSNGIDVRFLTPAMRGEIVGDAGTPSRLHTAPTDSLVRLVRSRADRGPVHAAIRRRIELMGGPDSYVIEAAPDRRLPGRTLADAARILDLEIEGAAIVLDLMGAHVTQFHMSEPDIERIMRAPFNATSSDGLVPSFGAGIVHPRAYGSFPRKLRRYVFERGVLTLEAALRSMSGLSADILGFTDRGYLRENYHADVVVFDPDRVRDLATYARPHRYSEGVVYLVVNGELVLDRSEFTGRFPGRVLRPAPTAAPDRVEPLPAATGGGRGGPR